MLMFPFTKKTLVEKQSVTFLYQSCNSALTQLVSNHQNKEHSTENDQNFQKTLWPTAALKSFLRNAVTEVPESFVTFKECWNALLPFVSDTGRAAGLCPAQPEFFPVGFCSSRGRREGSCTQQGQRSCLGQVSIGHRGKSLMGHQTEQPTPPAPAWR